MSEPSQSIVENQSGSVSRTTNTARAYSTTDFKDKGTFQDPAFALNRSVPVHRWVPWIAGYSQAFAEDAIVRFTSGSDQLILDPFAGVGTTLVEADRLGHRAVGFEINPYAVFAASIKLRSHSLNTKLLRETIVRLEDYGRRCEMDGIIPASAEPKGFRTREPFYSPEVLKKVLLIKDFIYEDLKGSGEVADVMRLAFAATMVAYSNYSYEPSLGRKAAAGRPEVFDFPVMETVVKKLSEIADDADWSSENRLGENRKGAAIYLKSFLDDYHEVDRHSVNLMITSPPYMNNYHYNRNTRPQLYWLGFCASPADLKPLEALNFGTYWQNARDQEPVSLDPVIDAPDILDTLERIREQNQGRGVYGGQGWANYATIYLNDSARFMKGLHWALHPEGTGLVVIGNSIIQGIEVPTDQFMACIAEGCGLEVRSLETPREARVGSSIVNSKVRTAQAPQRSHLYESVIELGHKR